MLGLYVYHTHGAGGHTQMASQISESASSCAAFNFYVSFSKLAQKHQEDIHSCGFMAFISQV